MMTVWKNKHLVILGAARQGLALAKFLAEQGVQITLTDQKDESDLSSEMKKLKGTAINWVLGGHPHDLLDSADGLALSGGVPLDIPFVREARQRGIPLTNDSQIFLELAPCPVVGITGSAGKTTTTTLVGKIAGAAQGKERTWVGGNIGNPLISDLDAINEDHLAVIELSSFQTDLMTISPDVACVLNVTPNHLDRHRTMEAYTAAKARILDFQEPSQVAVLNREDSGSWNLMSHVKGKLITFGREKPSTGVQGTYLDRGWIHFVGEGDSRQLLPENSIKLRGEHNLQNVLAACAIAAAAGLPDRAMREGVESLTGVEHRLEPVRIWKGIEWVNDSKATTPNHSIAAIKSFQEPIVLLAGGRDKDLSWADFAHLALKRIKSLVLFGEAADLIQKALEEQASEEQGNLHYWKTPDLRGAVQKASEIAEPGDVVLLSPGGTSFDEFEDFEERGRKFKKWVSELK